MEQAGWTRRCPASGSDQPGAGGGRSGGIFVPLRVQKQLLPERRLPPLDGLGRPLRRPGGGWALENGVWLLEVEDGAALDRVSEIPYTLRLYDGADTLLAERSGTLWE